MARKKQNVDPSDRNTRIAKIMIYQKLLESPLIDPKGDHESIVLNELNQFIQDQLDILTGIKPDHNTDREKELAKQIKEIYTIVKEVKGDSFEKTEKLALSALAKKVLNPDPPEQYVQNTMPVVPQQPMPQNVPVAKRGDGQVRDSTEGRLPMATAHQMEILAQQQANQMTAGGLTTVLTKTGNVSKEGEQ